MEERLMKLDHAYIALDLGHVEGSCIESILALLDWEKLDNPRYC
jgi:hypothetical protein